MKYSLGERLRQISGPLLLTGHTGFKGTWLTFLLEHLNVPVIGYSLPPEKDSLYTKTNRTGAIPEKYADIRDYEALKNFINIHKPSTIIHMAAQPLVLNSYENPLETFDINVMGTANLLDASIKTKSAQVVVIVTTDKVYKNDNLGKRFMESDPLKGKDPYSASKVGTESVVDAWQQISKISGGPKIVSVRAGNVIGGGDLAKDRLIPDVIRSHLSRKSLVVRNKNSTRPWQHVLDPLSGYIRLIDSLIEGKSISSMNFGPNEKSLNVTKVIEIMSKNIEFDFEIQNTGANLENIESLTLELDTSYAKSILDWQSIYNQETAIQKTANWWVGVLSDGILPKAMCDQDIIEFLRLSS
jgi:CDP-glucose 4,6-dehydratase